MEHPAVFDGGRPGNHGDLPWPDAPFWCKVQTLCETQTSKTFLATKAVPETPRRPKSRDRLPHLFAVERIEKLKVDAESLQRCIRARAVVRERCSECVNIRRTFGMWQDMEYVYTACEPCERGDVFTLLAVLRGRNDVRVNELLRSFVQQMLMALRDLHANSLAHLDVCLENFLVTKDNTVKLAGLTRVCQASAPARGKDLQSRLQDDVGISDHALYAPPELSGGGGAVEDLTKVDCFQVGVAIAALVFGDHRPVPALPASAAGFELAIEEPSRNLLQRLMAPRPERRPTADAALQGLEADLQELCRQRG